MYLDVPDQTGGSDHPSMRVRLKVSFDNSGFSPAMQVILRAMKKYGMMVADNGSNWYVSGAPDPRWNDRMSVTRYVSQGGDGR